MTMKIKTKTDLKKIPIGTKLRLVQNLLGPCDKDRVVLRVAKGVGGYVAFRAPEFGEDIESYLNLDSIKQVQSDENGFSIFVDGHKGLTLAAKYIFVEEKSS